MAESQKVPILPCGRCGAAARQEQGLVGNTNAAPPVRFRCSRDRSCLQGPEGELGVAVHGWNRVTQGWVGMDILLALAKEIPEMAPQITKAMESRFKALSRPGADDKITQALNNSNRGFEA